MNLEDLKVGQKYKVDSKTGSNTIIEIVDFNEPNYYFTFISSDMNHKIYPENTLYIVSEKRPQTNRLYDIVWFDIKLLSPIDTKLNH